MRLRAGAGRTRVQAPWAALGLGNLVGRFALRRDATRLARLQFLCAGAELGLLRALRSPRTAAELAGQLGAVRGELLEAVLRVGVALRELSLQDSRYALSGARAKAIAHDNGALEGLLAEMFAYHGSVYAGLPSRLAGAGDGDYLPQFAEVIAASSRIFEPFLAPWVSRTVRRTRPRRLLEVGCGSGVYLLHACRAHHAVRGVGIEMQPSVARAARENLQAWGIADRFRIEQADVRTLALEEDFDLVTLYNNIYYFDPDERAEVLARLRASAPGGRLALASMMRGGTVASASLDLVLRSTSGCFELPARAELAGALRDAGWSRITWTLLLPGEPFFALLAR